MSWSHDWQWLQKVHYKCTLWLLIVWLKVCTFKISTSLKRLLFWLTYEMYWSEECYFMRILAYLFFASGINDFLQFITQPAKKRDSESYRYRYYLFCWSIYFAEVCPLMLIYQWSTSERSEEAQACYLEIITMFLIIPLITNVL